MSTDWVKLASYPLPPIAELLRCALEANGIKAIVFNSQASSIMPHLNQIIPADVMVQGRDLEEARKLLFEFENAPEFVE